MGLEDADLLDDGGGGAKASSLVSCSICLEAVTDNGDRSWSKLHCGHQFHLDCIGSAFNVKGVMQCPNCRKIEKGQWLFANGCRSFPEFNMDDWAHDEDLYDLSYSEMNGDVADLEWLSKFVEDTFSNYPQINVTGTSPAPSNTTTWTSMLESITPTMAKSKPHMKIESTEIKWEVYSSSFVLTRHSNSHRKVMKLQQQKEMREEGQHQQQLEVHHQLYEHHHHRNYESFGVHWCPFSGLTRVPSLDEGEFSSTAYHDLLGQPAIFAEHAAVSSATHPCPYIAYIGPVHPSSSNSNSSVAEGPPTYNNQWNSQSTSNEIPNSYAFPTMDVHYQSWEHHSSPFPTTSSRLGVADQSSIPSMTQRSSRATSDRPRSASYVHPFLVGQSSAARAPSSVGSSMIPPYPGSVARARDRVQALQAYFQQPSSSPAMRTPIVSGTRRSSSHRAAGIAQVGPVASSSDQSRGGFYFFPSSGSSTARSFQEAENPMSNPFHHAWEREPHLSSFPVSQVDRDQVWGPFHQPSSGSDNGARSTSFRQRHGSERMPSQSHHHRS